MSDARNAVPYDWWHSGRFWYCRVHPKVRSGAGPTKTQAANDAMKELKKYQLRHGLHASGSGDQK